MLGKSVRYEMCVESGTCCPKSNALLIKSQENRQNRRKRRLSFRKNRVLLISSLTFVSPVIIIVFFYISVITATTMRTVFIISPNHRRAASSGQKSLLSIYSSRESSVKSLNVRPSCTMITDSRELRFMDGCPKGSIVSTSCSCKSVLWTNVTESEKQVSTIWAQVESLEKSFRLQAEAISSKGTMSVVEEMISTSYFRVLEENHGIVSTVLGPLLDTIHTGGNYQSRDQKQRQQEQRTYNDLGTTVTLPATESESPFSFLGRTAIKQPQGAAHSSMMPKNSREFSTVVTRTDKFSTMGLKQSNVINKTEKNDLPPLTGYGSSIQLTDEERELFQLLRRVRKETNLSTTLRVAGGWIRDKLLATPEFQAYHKVFSVGKADSGSGRLTSKFRTSSPSMGRQGTKVLAISPRSTHGDDCQPVDIDIALDDMLGREFADHLNEYLALKGEKTVSIGMVLKNPEKSKHLETATMKINSFWIDFVNLRAEEYTQNSRIPDLMRIGNAKEDSYRRDLTINSLFYNVNTGEVEDWTGRGFDDLRKGIIATPLHPLTTLLDDPLRVLRSIRFAARLRFTMDSELVAAAKDKQVATALRSKVSRERVGGELDLMIRSPDPVSAIRLLINLNLMDCVFPIANYCNNPTGSNPEDELRPDVTFQRGLELLCTTLDHLADCRWSPPVWCSKHNEEQPDNLSIVSYDAAETLLLEDDESQRLLWYAAFVTPMYHEFQAYQERLTNKNQSEPNNPKAQSKRSQGKKANRSIISMLFVDELKRPNRDAEAIEKIVKASDEFIQLVHAGGYNSAEMVLLSDIQIVYSSHAESFLCYMHGRKVDSCIEEDPVWEHAMEFRLLCSKVMQRVGPLWRAALCLSIARELMNGLHDNTFGSNGSHSIQYVIEGDVIDESQEEFRQGIIERFDVFATALQQVGLIGIWNERPIVSGDTIRAECLHGIPQGPAFRDVMDEQLTWMTTHPGRNIQALYEYLKATFPDYVEKKKEA